MNDVSGATLPLSLFLERVHSQIFGEFPLWQDQEGKIWGRVFKTRISSLFAPVVLQNGERLAYLGQIELVDDWGTPLAFEGLFNLVRDDGLVRLDRFCRSLHVLNRPEPDELLFLPIHPQLPLVVNTDHGQAFELILNFFGISTSQIVICLPTEVTQNPELAQRVSANYQLRGYQVAWVNMDDQIPMNQVQNVDWALARAENQWLATPLCISDKSA